MSEKPSGKCTMIQPGSYPALHPAAAAAFSRQLRDPKTAAAAAQALEEGAGGMRQAVQTHIDRLQRHVEHIRAAVATGDFPRIYQEAHEVRGLAGNAGLTAAAQIAGGLCRYLDAMMRAGLVPDTAVVRLHLEAAVRAARAEDEATRLGSTVADSLGALVSKKLAEINAL